MNQKGKDSNKNNWLFSNQTNNLTKILIALIPAVLAYIGSVTTSAKMINNQQIVKVDNKQTLINSPENGKIEISEPSISVKEEKKSSFIKENWIFYKEINPNEDGYYCPGQPGFPNWVIWTKNKYKADKEISLSFYLLDKTNNNKNPTLVLSYGDKTNKKPIVYYSLNILDGDLNTIRLYNQKGNDVIFERSREDILLDSYITVNISPVFMGKDSSKLIINPKISYLVESKEESFTPKKEFKIELPFTSENQGDGFQFAIGVSKGDCFKIISSNI